MLNITPREVLTFPSTKYCEVTIILSCKSVVPVIYKIQTTSPEKFRVRPRHGLLEPRQSITINVLLRSEHRLDETLRDKFLILGMPAPMDKDLSTPQSIADIWKQKSHCIPAIEQHRLSCAYEKEEIGFRKSSPIGNGSGQGYTNGDMNELAQQTQKLERQLKFTQFMQYFTIFILLLMSVAVVYLLRLEMDFGFLKFHNASTRNAPVNPNIARQIPLSTRLSNSLPKMGRLSRGFR